MQDKKSYQKPELVCHKDLQRTTAGGPSVAID